jgi:hypothetical protein
MLKKISILAIFTVMLSCSSGIDPEGSRGPAECVDNFDNDQDGLIDCADPDCCALDACSAAPECTSTDTSPTCGLWDDYAQMCDATYMVSYGECNDTYCSALELDILVAALTCDLAQESPCADNSSVCKEEHSMLAAVSSDCLDGIIGKPNTSTSTSTSTTETGSTSTSTTETGKTTTRTTTTGTTTTGTTSTSTTTGTTTTGTTGTTGTTTTEVCDYPTVDLSDGTYGNASTFSPYYLGVTMSGFLDEGVIHDGYIDGIESSSVMGFTFIDIDFNEICTVQFDASNSATSSFSTDDFGTMFEAWTISISNGVTDCQMLDVGVFGTTSVHDFLSSIPWGIGIGPMGGSLGIALESTVVDSGLDWDAEWAPYVSKMYVSVDGKTSYAIGYNFEYASTCENLTSDASGEFALKEVSTSGPLSSYNSSSFYYMFNLQ